MRAFTWLLGLTQNTCIMRFHLVVILVNRFYNLALHQHRYRPGRCDDGCKIVNTKINRHYVFGCDCLFNARMCEYQFDHIMSVARDNTYLHELAVSTAQLADV